jgi:hypothetical protein
MISMPFGAYDYTPHHTKESFEFFDMTHAFKSRQAYPTSLDQ